MTIIYINQSLRARIGRKFSSLAFRVRHHITMWKFQRRFPCKLKKPF